MKRGRRQGAKTRESLCRYLLPLLDFVILNKNPLENIRNSNTVELVVKNGFVYEGETLNTVYPEVKKQDYPWTQASPSNALPGIGKGE